MNLWMDILSVSIIPTLFILYSYDTLKQPREEGIVKQRTWVASTTLILLSTLLLVVMSLLTIIRVEQVYTNNTAQSIEQLKRRFLYDAVNNQIKRIDTQRELTQQFYLSELDRTICMVDHIYSSGSEHIDRIVSYFTSESNTLWTAILWEKSTGNVLLDNHSQIEEGLPAIETVDRLSKEYQVYTIKSYGLYNLYLGIPQSFIDAQVQEYIAKEIYDSKYSEDSYIWVNEVVNYEGGDAYAIRRIHPNLRDTVGTLLSTSMTDVRGSTPYKTELEGVKQNGELFFTYYFKKMGSDIISEKLTYAKLYKDFDWIVAMGIHLDDLTEYIDETTGQSTRIVRQIAPVFIISILVLFVLHSLLLVYLEHRRNKKSEHILEEQVYQDPLTGIGNRRFGLMVLKDRFLQFKRANTATLIALFDVDFFKQINDTYGHDIGDRCLVQLSKAISQVICTEKSLFRWGGDEFLIICPSVATDELERVKKTLLETAQATYITYEGISITLTISVGISSFFPADESEEQILKRADKALYRAKQLGRNRIETEL